LCKWTATETAPAKMRHAACVVFRFAGGAVTLEARVIGFLLFHESRDFCDACLGARLGAATAAIAVVVKALRRRSSVVLRDRWACAMCGKVAEVTRALPGPTVATKSKLRRRATHAA
jgi:hypothetical protein